MTITLSYLDDLSRVRIQASGLAPGYVRVERSIAGGPWETVRGAAALEVMGGTITVDDYEFAADTENLYRIVPAVDQVHDRPSDDQTWGEPWQVPAGVRTLTVQCWGAGGATSGAGAAVGGAGGGAYAADEIQVAPGEVLQLRVGRSGWNAGLDGNSTAVIRNSTLLVQAAGGRGTVNTMAGAAGGSASFPASIGTITHPGGAGGDGDPTGGGGGGGGSATATAAGADGGNAVGATGGAGGAGEGPGGTGGDDGEAGELGGEPGGGAGGHGASRPGQVLGGHGRITVHSWPDGVPEQDSITPSLDGKVWLKSIRYPALNRVVSVRFRDEQLVFPGRLGLHAVKSKAAPVAVFDQRGSRQHTLTVRVDSAEDARLLELMLMVSGELLLHVPASSTVPGGYLAVGDLSRVRTTAGSPYWWTLPCTLVDPPGPEVTPTTLTWGTVRRLYGSWSALVAAHPTWSSLLAVVGDPDDPVVI